MFKKLSKKIILMLLLVLGIAITTLVFFQKQELEEEVHYHAGFVVFKDGKQIDFSDIKYMHVLPCNLEEEVEEHEDEQIEKAHLHDQVGDVVHVHRENAKWEDLFTNINYKIDQNSSTYLNGEEINNFLEAPVKPYDSLVVLIGKNDVDEVLSKAVKKDHIQETEKRSENCGT